MNQNLNDVLYNAEKNHWWFHSRRNIISYLFWNKYVQTKQKLNILSIGSSSGAEIEYLSKYGNVTGIDLDDECIKYCRNKNLNILKEDITNCSFENESVDIIFAMDVLEHIPDHKKACCEIYRILKKEGLLVITVPACQFLWSKHDELGPYPHQRRYSKKKLLNLLEHQGFKILRLSYYNFFLFPLVFLTRKILKVSPLNQLKVPNKYINQFFKVIFFSEKYFLKHLNFPLGSSLIAICWKSKERLK